MRRFIDGAIHGPIHGAIFFDFFSNRTSHVACYWKGYKSLRLDEQEMNLLSHIIFEKQNTNLFHESSFCVKK